MTDIACIAWNAAVCRHRQRPNDVVIANVRFRNLSFDLIEDFGHIWGRRFENEENQILAHFETLLDRWAAEGDAGRLRIALNQIILRNRSSLMWRVVLETGAKYPGTFGRTLEPLLTEPLFLTHVDYNYAGVALFSALHRSGKPTQRKRLEQLIIDLPANARFLHEEPREPVPEWLQHSIDKLIGTLESGNIVLAMTRKLRDERLSHGALPENPEPRGFEITSHTLSDEELLERRGISLKDPVNANLRVLRDSLALLKDQDGQKINPKQIDQNWGLQTGTLIS